MDQNRVKVSSRLARVLAACALAQATEAYCVQGIPVLMFLIKRDIALTAVQMGALASAPYFANLISFFSVGQLLEKWGGRKVVFAGLCLMGVGMAACSTSLTFGTMYISLVAGGIGFTTVYPGTTKVIMEQTPTSLRGTFMGLKQMGVAFGAALAAAMLPGLALEWSWRKCLMYVGLSAAAISFVWAWAYGNSDRVPEPSSRSVPYSYYLRHPGLWLINLTSAVLMLVQVTTVVWLPTYLRQGLSWDPVLAGRAAACLQVGGALGRGFLGAISDALGQNRTPVASSCGVLACLGLLGMSLTTPSSPRLLVYCLCAITGCFAVGWVGAVTVMRAETIPDQVGRVTALGTAFMALGAVSGPPVFGWATRNQTSFPAAWRLLALAGLAAAVLAVAAGRAVRRAADQATV